LVRFPELSRSSAMRKRFLIGIAIFVALVMGSSLYSTADNSSNSSTAAITIDGNKQKKDNDSKLAKVFTAPFRAIGRFFSGKKNSNSDIAAKTEKSKVEKEKVQKDPKKDSIKEVTKVSPRKEEKIANNSLEVERFKKASLSPFLPSTPTQSGTAPIITNNYLENGRALLESGKIDEAIAELSIAASTSTNIVEANSLLGAAYDRKGLYREARECYERVFRAVPDEPKALNNWGCSLYQQGKYKEAVDILKKASKAMPGSTQVLNNLALAQGRAGKYDDAYKSFLHAGGELHARLNVGLLLEQTKRYSDALKHYEKAAKLSPNSTNITQRIANLNSILGKGSSKVVFTPLETK
jgi:tetratricopeptide (TPR) repeat protein